MTIEPLVKVNDLVVVFSLIIELTLCAIISTDFDSQAEERLKSGEFCTTDLLPIDAPAVSFASICFFSNLFNLLSKVVSLDLFSSVFFVVALSYFRLPEVLVT